MNCCARSSSANALSVALNRKAINDLLFLGLAKEANLGLSTASPYWDGDMATIAQINAEYNPDKARRLLVELGLKDQNGDGMLQYADGSNVTFLLGAASEINAHVNLAEMVVADWKAVGIDARLHLQTRSLMFSGIRELQFHAVTFGTTDLLFPQFRLNEGPIMPGYQSPSFVQDPPDDLQRIWDLTDEIITTVDADTVGELRKEHQRLRAENNLGIWAAHDVPLMVIVHNRLQNVPTAEEIVIDNADIRYEQALVVTYNYSLDAAEAHTDQLRSLYGLDRNFVLRFFTWLVNFLRGEFGVSFNNFRPVSDLIGQRPLYSIAISSSALIFMYVVGVPIGLWTAYRQYGVSDYAVSVVAFIGLSIPNFFLALLVIGDRHRGSGQDRAHHARQHARRAAGRIRAHGAGQGAGGAGGGAQARLPGGGESSDQPVRDAVPAHPVGRGGGLDRARTAHPGTAAAGLAAQPRPVCEHHHSDGAGHPAAAWQPARRRAAGAGRSADQVRLMSRGG